MTAEPIELPQVVAQNVRRLRGKKTMDNLAVAGQEYGMNWSSGSIGAIERGLFKPTLETLAILTQALADLHGDGTKQTPLPLAELLRTDAPIRLSEGSIAPTGNLEQWVTGGQLQVQPAPELVSEVQAMIREQLDRIDKLTLPESITRREFRKLPNPTPGDKRVAKQAGIDPVELVAWSHHLWGAGFEQYRNDMAGEDSTAQKKGRVSRTLREEIIEAMKENRGDD